MDLIENDDGTNTIRYRDGSTITFRPSTFWTTLMPISRGLTSYSFKTMDLSKPIKKIIWI